MAANTNPNRSAWVQLYEARSVPSEPELRSPGRPPGIVPRRKVGLTLSQGEVTEIDRWQERFSDLMGRKVSAGETVGILTRICSARLTHLRERLGDDLGAGVLSAFVDKLVGEE
ncbi:MAG: hypothetical protein FD147_2401 [Chloroflexi bacterium]|nr:MAG: hypothetical protein FD147_2401 [Chloroflexota bacterium]MBA4376357.1 hypothetical protein [Anaerolinea sp.]